jgi:hypothetical protein
MADDWPHAKKPCTECPWRRDVEPGRFPASRYRLLAGSSYDISAMVFACHKSPEGREFACAGFLLRGAAHNLSVRMAAARGAYDFRAVQDGGFPLFDNYRQMAVANGVKARDPSLRNCRDDTW